MGVDEIQDFRHVLPLLLSLLENARFVTYGNMAAYAMLLFDYLLTFGQEVELVWPTPWSLAKLMFFLTRYPPFLDGAILLHYYTAPPATSVRTCAILFKVSGWLIVLGVFIAELVLVFRTWAIWGKNRHLAIGLLFLMSILAIPSAIFVNKGLNRVEFGPSPAPQIVSCWITKNPDTILIVNYIMVVMFETVILGLTMCKGFQHLRHNRSSLVVTLYRDGALYYIYLIGFSLVNIIFLVVGPTPGPSLILMQRVLHSILSGRILLNLREAVNRDRGRRASSITSTTENTKDLELTDQPSAALSSVIIGADTTWFLDVDTGTCMRTSIEEV